MTDRHVIVLSEKAAAFANTPAVMPVVEDIYSIKAPKTEWFVIYTDANREPKVAEALEAIGVRSFFPRTIEWKPRTRAERDRKKPLEPIERPLLSRYLFAELPAAYGAFARVLQVDGVKNILGNGEDKMPVPRQAVEFLKEQEQTGVFNKTIKRGRVVAPKWAVEGCEVRILEGPFYDFRGVIEKCLPKNIVQIALSLFGRPTFAKMSLAQIEKS